MVDLFKKLAWFGACALVVSSCCPEGEGGFSVGASAELLVSPEQVAFPTVAIGDSDTITLTITNSADSTGTAELIPVELRSKDGFSTADFTFTQPETMTLEPGESTTMKVVYTPTDGVVDGGELVIDHHNSLDPKVVPITTLQQVGDIVIQPSPVTFGQVTGGTPTIKAIRIVNQGSKPVNIGTTSMHFDSSSDFKVLETYAPLDDGSCGGAEGATIVEYPHLLDTGRAYCVDLQYLPFGGGSDDGTLEVFPPYDPGAPSQKPVADAKVIGVEVGPELDITPGSKLDFGAVPIGDKNELTFTIANIGSEALIVDGVAMGTQHEDAFEAVEIVTEVAAGTAVEPNTGLQVTVRFAPLKPHPVSYGPLGFIEVYSNDGDEATTFVTVFGQVASPKLLITPPEIVDFGIVALNLSADRTFTMTNVGTVDMDVTELGISANSPAEEFEIVTELEAPFTIEAGGHRVLELRFTNHGGPANEEVWGELSFATTDPEGATKVDLRARRTDKAECIIELEPVQLNYGTVPYGKDKTMVLNMINVGSAPCSWSHATVHDGAGLFGFSICNAGPVSTSSNFEIIDPPPAVKDLIKPGMTWPLKVRFSPEANIFSAISEFTGFSGLVQVHVLDYAQGPEPVEVLSPQPKPTDGSYDCNLIGQSGIAHLAAIPGEIDFGLTTVGCHSQTHTVTLYNTGKAPLSVCDIKLEGCSPEFKLKNVPPIPACDENGGGIVLTQSSPQELDVVYAPQDINSDSCALAIYENSDVPSVTIPLYGSGTYDDEQTDVFTQLSGQMVDVLFVVDNSGSMSDEQNSLSSNFDHFVSAAGAWNTDFQIGVITTDMEEMNNMAAKLMGAPRFVTSGNDNVSSFKSNVKVGDNGSGTEQGLMAAQTALTAPLSSTYKPLTQCNADADCPDGAKCIESALQLGTSYCGGYNMEFLREDATLEIVFVSDEQDQSTANLTFYIDFFKSIKGFANENLFHAHAIVGPSGGCDGAGGSAGDGSRYRDVATETGGKIHSICDSNWAQKLEDIGSIAFGLKVQFFLSRPAIPETIVVSVDGQVCADGWEFQPDTNSVLFDENHPCMPQENQVIEIYYEVICFSE